MWTYCARVLQRPCSRQSRYDRLGPLWRVAVIIIYSTSCPCCWSLIQYSWYWTFLELLLGLRRCRWWAWLPVRRKESYKSCIYWLCPGFKRESLYQLRIVNRKSFVRRSRPLPPPPPTLPLPILPTLGRMEGGGRLGWRRQTPRQINRQGHTDRAEKQNRQRRMDTKIPGPVWPAAETPKTITLGLLSWDRAAVANSLLRLRFPKSCSSRPYRVNTVGTAWKQNKSWMGFRTVAPRGHAEQTLAGAAWTLSPWTGFTPSFPLGQCRVNSDRLLGGLAGLLTPLTFARHRLSPLAAFTSGAYFFSQSKAVTVNLRNLHCQL